MNVIRPTRRAIVAGAIATAGGLAMGCSGKASAAPPSPVFDVSEFGAVPGASAQQNTRAFAAASAALSRAGGGTLLVPPGTYDVGVRPTGQRRPGFPPDIILVENCTRAVAVIGDDVRLRAAPGLRFGSFHPRTGRRFDPPRLPFVDPAFRQDAYVMILVRGCRAPVTVEGFELDGNIAGLELGGDYDNLGRQTTAVGIILDSNTGAVTIRNVNTHHHGLDGIMVAHAGLTPRSPRYPVRLENVICDSNARQGLSWVGGTELTAIGCRFSRTGRARFSSAPTAGVDVEAEGSVCRNGRFIDCEFSDNAGVGFVVVPGNTSGMRLERCRFFGTTSYSAWPQGPDIAFDQCLFVGMVMNVFGDADPRRATRFTSCRFVGDRKLSPTGRIYGDFLVNFGGGCTNVLLDRCDLRAVDPAIALAWTIQDMRIADCTFEQAGPNISHPRGIYTGNSSIVSAGYVNIEGSRVLGSLTVNGRRMG